MRPDLVALLQSVPAPPAPAVPAVPAVPATPDMPGGTIMTPDGHVIYTGDGIPPEATVIAIAFFVMLAVIFIGVPIARAIARRMDRQSPAQTGSAELVGRLGRIEQTVEAIAIEVERVSEGQRYVTRLMSELRSLPAPNPLEDERLQSATRVRDAVPAARDGGERGDVTR